LQDTLKQNGLKQTGVKQGMGVFVQGRGPCLFQART